MESYLDFEQTEAKANAILSELNGLTYAEVSNVLHTAINNLAYASKLRLDL